MQTVKGCRSKSFPPDRLPSFPKSRYFRIDDTVSEGGGDRWESLRSDLPCTERSPNEREDDHP